jgi:hypothetical protein
MLLFVSPFYNLSEKNNNINYKLNFFFVSSIMMPPVNDLFFATIRFVVIITDLLYERFCVCVGPMEVCCYGDREL